MRDFKKYEIWQLSHEFTLEIYGLTSQIRRACSSIPTNISEGCGRDSDPEFNNRFLTIALGSANETEYLIILSNDLNYITKEKSISLIERINIIKRKTYQLKQKLTA